MGKLMTGSNGISSVWPFLGYTLRATLIGVGAGVLAGVAVGLLLSHSETTAKVFAPFITLINATPRIAIIPIIAIIAGPTITTTAISSFLVVFFIAFYNGYAGGRSVRPEIIQNARLLGASPIEIMLQIRLPYVAAWTFASLPNAISFGLTTVVTAELLTGQPGMGQLITDALTNSNATLTFSVVVLLAVAGLLLVIASDAVQKRVLHWWER
jgi:NitT/TauT family transport system permease protein